MFVFKNFLLISLGGILGTCARYSVSLLCQNFSESSFPFATLIVNTLGCFIAGLLLGFYNCYGVCQNSRLFFIVGFLGAFTTFSAYGLDTISMFFANKIKLGLLNILLNNILSLSSVVLGFLFSNLIFSYFKFFSLKK